MFIKLNVMKRNLIDLYHVWMNEMKVVVRDPALILIFLIVPGFYPLLYGFLFNNEVVSEVSMVVVDESQSALSREFVRDLDASHDVYVVGKVADMEEAKRVMAGKEASGILYIPSDFSNNINTGRQSTVRLYADMSSILNYKAMMLSVTEVSLKMGADIRVEKIGGKTAVEDEAVGQFVRNEWVSYYNIPNGFCAFFIPAVLILIIQQTMLLGISTLVGTNNDRKRYSVASRSVSGKRINPFVVTFGKAMCYISIYTVVVVWVLGIVPYIFNLPQLGDPWVLLAFCLPFMLSCTFFCMSLSYFCPQREFGILMFAGTSVIFLFLSGVSWPWIAIPGPLKAIAMLIPSTPGIQGFIKINTMGASLGAVWFEVATLWIQTLFYWIAATLMYKWWLNCYDPVYKRYRRINNRYVIKSLVV